MTTALAPAPSQTETALAQLDGLRAQLEQPDLPLEDALTARDKADLLRAYAHSAKLGLEVANQAIELRIRAERRAGAILRELLVAGPRRKRRDGVVRARRALPNGTLEQAGITAQQASNWSAISQLPDAEFEQRIQATRDAGRQLTVRAFVRASRQFLRQPGKGGNGPSSPVANALRRALLLLREIDLVHGEVELNLARGIVSIVDRWDLRTESDKNGRLSDMSSSVRAGVTREVTCLLCGRAQPASKPARCPVCQGGWLVA